MATVISVVSGKGGVGKSNTAANVAIGLSMLNNKVLALDMDIGLRNLDIILGVQDRVVYDLVDIIDGVCDLHKAIITDERFKNLRFIPAPQLRDRQTLSQKQITQFIDSVRDSYDYIIIDSPAGVDNGFKLATCCADRIILVVTPEFSSVRDGDYVVAQIETLLPNVDINILINRIRASMIATGEMMEVDTIVETLGGRLIGAVPEDELVITAGNFGEPVILNRASLAGKAFRNVSRRITGEKVEILKEEKRGFLRLLYKMFN